MSFLPLLLSETAVMRNSSFAALLAGLSAATLACSSDTPEPTSLTSTDAATAAAVTLPKVTPQSSGTTNRLQAISPVSNRVAWASGTGGTFAVTTDGGAHWHSGVVPGAADLQFRDVQGVSANVAYLMSIPGDDGTPSRIYKTTDGGDTWKRQFESNLSASFYDCFAFWDRDRGIAFSDPVGDGIIPALRVTDGKHWTNIGGRLPKARSGEFGFAASGTCVATQGTQNAWIITGGSVARVYATTDGGDSWKAYRTPIVQGLASGAAGGTTVAFRDARHGIIAGGDIGELDRHTRNVAVSSDGGATWELVTPTPIEGSVYGLAYAPAGGTRAVVATGPGGAVYSTNEGRTWHQLPGVSGCWAVAFADRVGWLVGVDGQILKLTF
jgi:photosystem II stability/assembly factor-like uncharacterized protein